MENDFKTYILQLKTTELLITPPNPAEVNSFCQSNVYWNIDRQSRIIRDSLIVEEKVEKDGMALYPNPNKGQFNVKFKHTGATLSSIFISDISGRRVYARNEGNLLLSNGIVRQLDLSLLSGTYILTAITSKGVLKSKFIVTR